MKKGFTLLELLIVIAVIGLLSSVILVSYNGYTEKAKLANTLQWASGLSHSLFYEAVGVWSFNEGSGQTAQDESGKGNNGTLGSTGGSDVNDPVWRCATTNSGYAPSGEGCSLEFDGADDFVFVANNENFRVVSAITITAWVKPDTLSGHDIAVSRTLPYLSRNSANAFFSTNISGKTEGGTTQTNLSGNKNMQIGKWHHVVGIFTVFI